MWSPSILKLTLTQAAITQSLQQSLVAAFAYGGPAWPLLELTELPPVLPLTQDPVLLALRRLISRNLDELRAMHRTALEAAASRPFGFLHLVLEEAAQIDHGDEPPPLEADKALANLYCPRFLGPELC